MEEQGGGEGSGIDVSAEVGESVGEFFMHHGPCGGERRIEGDMEEKQAEGGESEMESGLEPSENWIKGRRAKEEGNAVDGLLPAWGDLNNYLLELIGRKVGARTCASSMTLVCRRWREAASSLLRSNDHDFWRDSCQIDWSLRLPPSIFPAPVPLRSPMSSSSCLYPSASSTIRTVPLSRSPSHTSSFSHATPSTASPAAANAAGDGGSGRSSDIPCPFPLRARMSSSPNVFRPPAGHRHFPLRSPMNSSSNLLSARSSSAGNISTSGPYSGPNASGCKNNPPPLTAKDVYRAEANLAARRATLRITSPLRRVDGEGSLKAGHVSVAGNTVLHASSSYSRVDSMGLCLTAVDFTTGRVLFQSDLPFPDKIMHRALCSRPYLAPEPMGSQRWCPSPHLPNGPKENPNRGLLAAVDSLSHLRIWDVFATMETPSAANQPPPPPPAFPSFPPPPRASPPFSGPSAAWVDLELRPWRPQRHEEPQGVAQDNTDDWAGNGAGEDPAEGTADTDDNAGPYERADDGGPDPRQVPEDEEEEEIEQEVPNVPLNAGGFHLDIGYGRQRNVEAITWAGSELVVAYSEAGRDHTTHLEMDRFRVEKIPNDAMFFRPGVRPGPGNGSPPSDAPCLRITSVSCDIVTTAGPPGEKAKIELKAQWPAPSVCLVATAAADAVGWGVENDMPESEERERDVEAGETIGKGRGGDGRGGEGYDGRQNGTSREGGRPTSASGDALLLECGFLISTAPHLSARRVRICDVATGLATFSVPAHGLAGFNSSLVLTFSREGMNYAFSVWDRRSVSGPNSFPNRLYTLRQPLEDGSSLGGPKLCMGRTFCVSYSAGPKLGIVKRDFTAIQGYRLEYADFRRHPDDAERSRKYPLRRLSFPTASATTTSTTISRSNPSPFQRSEEKRIWLDRLQAAWQQRLREIKADKEAAANTAAAAAAAAAAENGEEKDDSDDDEEVTQYIALKSWQEIMALGTSTTATAIGSGIGTAAAGPRARPSLLCTGLEADGYRMVISLSDARLALVDFSCSCRAFP